MWRVTSWPHFCTDKSGKISVSRSDRQAAYRYQTRSYRLKDTEMHRQAGLTCGLCHSLSKAGETETDKPEYQPLPLVLWRINSTDLSTPALCSLFAPTSPFGLKQSARTLTAGVSILKPDYKYITCCVIPLVSVYLIRVDMFPVLHLKCDASMTGFGCWYRFT